VVTTCAAFVSPELCRWIERNDDELLPIAEIARQLGDEADRRGLTRPSYERVRQLIHESRLRRRRRPPRYRPLIEAALTNTITRGTIDRVLLPPE
jgi:hypothetical protein